MSLLIGTSWINFLLSIKRAKEEMGNPEIIWFRGQGNSAYFLQPSLLRYKNGIDQEEILFHKFRRFSDKIFKNKDSEWETLFDMQHYGIPTRLLDWTETLGIALFFAVYNNSLQGKKVDAAVYLLNPIELNKQSGLDKINRLPHDEAQFPYCGIYWNKKPFKATAPIAIEPIFRNDRILAQRGMFTVHHDNIEQIETRFPTIIKKIVLKSDAILAAQEFLELANINEYSVYPDLAGISSFLKKSSGLKT